ncbi:hypothetical protein [Mucilaginibacter pineti]|uniref:hypothetical protein n=1 Tax=Mucilaginibacter pineti TaxID=1391627 RepID=UPI000B899F9B|nr:hypothetical protein [Mucilaginibacter pineti]
MRTFVAAQGKRALFFENLVNKINFRKVKISLDKMEKDSHLCNPKQIMKMAVWDPKRGLEKNLK